MNPFSKAELERYSRHLIIPEFGLNGQQRLKSSSVLVVGAGGLGAPLLQYLTAAGIGRIGILDFDVVEESNLQRQVLFTMADIGRPKAEAARDRLHNQNPHVDFEVFNERLTSANALEILNGFDIIADGTDNFPTRYLINDACIKLNKVNVYASIYRFEGQLSVFNFEEDKGKRGPNFRDLFPQPPPAEMIPSCAEGGVIGVLPGIMGSLQANEVIKIATGVGDVLTGRLFIFDTASFETRILNLKKLKSNKYRSEFADKIELIDYEEFCDLRSSSPSKPVESISVIEWDLLRRSEKPVQLIDVREPYEYDIADIGGLKIPQSEVRERVAEIRADIPVVLYCRSGKRSAEVIRELAEKFGLHNLINLTGGIRAYAEQVDHSIAKY